MLFERTVYLDDFPMNIRIAKITEYPFHYHQDVEFVYVLKGEVYLKDVSSHYLLKEGDIFTINGHEVHGITATDKDNAIAIIQISNRFFTQYFPTLDKACYMSYAYKDKYLKLDVLRKMLLQILSDYSRKSFDYKQSCTDRMIQVISYLNMHFNLFAFESNMIVNFNNDNPVAIERISRIINYVYANHKNKVTLEDIAEREHLNPFYLSHLIKDYMGISFQEFLCFARVEMSEIPLLETDKKISAIANDVGFSTTSYYDKYFSRWFGHTPLEHRQLYTSQILSQARPADLILLPENKAINIIRRRLSAINGQENSALTVSRLHFSVEVDPQTVPVRRLNCSLEVIVTPEDYHIMGERLFSMLYDLGARKVLLLSRRKEDDSILPLLANRLNFIGFETGILSDHGLENCFSAGNDSIASAIEIFLGYFMGGAAAADGTGAAAIPKPGGGTCNIQCPRCFLRDQGDSLKILKGSRSCMTSCLIPKPSYYAYRLLRNIKGQLLYMGKYYFVVKDDSMENPAYILAVINHNDDIRRLCSRKVGAFEADDVSRSFKDELNIDFTIPLADGKYAVGRYALTDSNSVLSHMARLEFADTFPLPESWARLISTEPMSQVYMETVSGKINVSSAISGAGIEIIVIAPAEDAESPGR